MKLVLLMRFNGWNLKCFGLGGNCLFEKRTSIDIQREQMFEVFIN